jgi:SAM-dependent methyltransferase
MHIIHRKTCRLCGSTALTPVIDLGEQYLQGSFIKEGLELPPKRRIPLCLVRCDSTVNENACGLLQLECSVPPEILYSSYWYRSGTNFTMTEHLKEIAKTGASLINNPDAIVLDIGCNDGTLLRNYPPSYKKFGIDPSNIVNDIVDDMTVVKDLFPSKGLNVRLPQAKCDIITSIAMFYDLEDPVGFAREIKALLSEKGIWVFEMSYMPTMLEMNSYDTICHEHLEYYSLAVIEYILRKADMRLFKAELNSINGGSLRCYTTHDDNICYQEDRWMQDIRKIRKKEFDMELDTDKPYRIFQERINSHREHLLALLIDLKKRGFKLHIYGASTKGNTILQWCGIDNRLIECAADRNVDKHGAMTIGTNIPIISEEESRAMKPDYYLVLPWHFKEEFVIREREILKQGTKMIFPLPEIEIIGNKEKTH